VDESSLMVQANSGQAAGSAAPAVTAVVNAGSYAQGAVAPGEIVAVFGSGFTSDAKVTFDGNAAPLLYVSSGLINLVVPYEVAGHALTSMVVTAGGTAAPPQNLSVAAAAPGVFVVLNHDRKRNTAANPAAQGSVLIVYGTGEGQTSPPGTDGKITMPPPPWPQPLLPVSATVGGVNARLNFSGAAPFLIAGAWLVDVQLPPGVPSGPAVPLTLNVGGITTTVNVAIQ
jgi:uncharacterized protein (TIGR03437 family)